MYRQGTFTIFGSPTGIGAGTNLASVINWALHTFSATADSGPYRFTGTGQTGSTNADGSVTINIPAAATLDSRAATNNVNLGSNQLYSAGATLSSATNVTVDWDDGNMQEIVLSTNITFAFVNVQTFTTYMMRLRQDDIGSRTVAWPASLHWYQGVAPTLSTATGRWDIVNFAVFADTNEISGRGAIYWGP
jgi:hypothetical protein